MATEVPVSSLGTAKIRHPVAVPALSVVTLGIYLVYWWYQLNREMRDFGDSREIEDLARSQPTNSLLALFPGVLLLAIPSLFSLYNGTKRLQQVQTAATGGPTLNGWIVLGLMIASLFVGLVALVVPGYLQSEADKAWQTLQATTVGPNT